MTAAPIDSPVSADRSTGRDAADPAAEAARYGRRHWNNQIRRHAMMIGDQTALRFAGESITWAQLSHRVDALGAALSRRGVGAGDRVLILMLNRPEVLETVFAVNALGAVAVPVNIRMAVPEVAYVASDSGAGVVVADEALAPLAYAVAQQVEAIELAVVTGGADGQAPAPVRAEAYEDLIAEDGPAPTVDVADDALALIMYTSGTTGKPKGAMLSHANMQAQAMTTVVSLQTDVESISVLAAPLFHIAAIGSATASIYMGSTMVINPLGAFDPDNLLDMLERERVTSIFLVPAQWQVVCAAQRARPRDLSLKVISWGAAPASQTLLAEMNETFPDALNVAAFGQTETAPLTCVMHGDDAMRKIGSVGKVVPGVAARIVDDDMNDVPVGQVGEIVYRGANVTSGYWHNPTATSDAFRGGWFHSGDLVRMDDEGFIYVVDRKKDMIISGGENIYCAEVENALYAHPEIVEAAVIANSDPRWGEVPVAVVVLSEGSHLGVEELSAFLDDHLARYKHPKRLVVVDELPRNPSGKVVKPTLRERFGGRDEGLASADR